MATNPEIDLLGPFTAYDTDMNSIHVRKTIYLPAPFMGILLERNLTPVEVWSFLRDTIVNAGATVDCQCVIEWIRITLTSKSAEYHSSYLAIP